MSDNIDYEMKRPFGPSLYYSHLDNDFLNFLKIIADQTKNNPTNIGNKLAGNISSQLSAVINPNQIEQFFKGIYPHIFQAFKEFTKIPNNSDVLSYNLGDGPWINYQRKNEFNPMHRHSGELSAILYIDVPECIAQENDQPIVNTNMPSYGKIIFMSGSSGMYHQPHYEHQPITGELFIIPAELAHQVYPFNSDVERISMSFNVMNIEIHPGTEKNT